MEKAHLFFVKYENLENKLYMTIKIQMKNVNDNVTYYIKRIINNLLKNNLGYRDIDEYDVNIKKINEDMLIEEASLYLRNFIYFDYKINSWVLSSKNEPDYNILNYMSENVKLKLFCVGEEYSKIIMDENQRIDLFNTFERLYHIKPQDVSYIGNSDTYFKVDNLYDVLPDDSDKLFAIIISENMKISDIKKICDKFNYRDNVKIYLQTNIDTFNVMIKSGKIIFKRMVIR